MAFFRDSDRTLLAGDAVATMNMDSYVEMVTKQQDFAPAGRRSSATGTNTARSVEALAALEPGRWLRARHPMGGRRGGGRAGSVLRGIFPRRPRALRAEPAHTDERGVDSLPPRPSDPVATVLLAAVVGLAIALFSRRRRS